MVGGLAVSASAWRCCAVERGLFAGNPLARGGDGPSQDPRSWAVPPFAAIPDCCMGCFPHAVMVSGDGDLWVVLHDGCCCVLLSALAVCLVFELVSAAPSSVCQPSVLAAAAIAGGICFFAPYVASYKSPYLMADQGAIGPCQH